MRFRAGQQIGIYTLIDHIGRGGFGEVWRAERRTKILTTTVAVKLLLDEQVDHATIQQEAQLWAQASGHPNVLPIIEANDYDGQVVIVSEYSPDGSLEDLLKKNDGLVPITRAVELTVGILKGLEFLHSRKIIHRDLKPANILLQGDTPRLADFGISWLMRTTSVSVTIAGTPHYMAPEAFEGRRNVQTDIWSIGVILYQLLTGELPFPQKDYWELRDAIATKEAASLPETVSQGLRKIISKALSKNSAERYSTAREMLQALYVHDYANEPTLIIENETVARPSSPEVNLIPYKNNKTGKWGFCDENKRVVIHVKYDDVELFKEGIARVRLGQKYGFIDKTGREITPFKYYIADENFRGGVARVNIVRDEHMRDLKAGYIDKTGKEIIPVKYDWPPYFYFSEGLVSICFNNKWGFIDDTGKIVVPFQYEKASPFREGLAAVKLNDKWGFINKKGEVVVQFQFHAASSFSEGLANVQRGTNTGFFKGSNKQWGFIDKNGEEAIPFKYDYQATEYNCKVFSDGLACIKRDGKFGFIDRTGELVVPFRNYDFVSPFIEGQEVAYVRGLYDGYPNKYGFIDKTGYEIVQRKYIDNKTSSIFQVVGGNVIAGKSMFHDGLACVQMDEHKCGFIDRTDYEVIPFKYHKAEPFSEGLACVSNGRYGYIDTAGQEVIPFKYDRAGSFREGLARVWLYSDCFYIDTNGTEYYED